MEEVGRGLEGQGGLAERSAQEPQERALTAEGRWLDTEVRRTPGEGWAPWVADQGKITWMMGEARD